MPDRTFLSNEESVAPEHKFFDITYWWKLSYALKLKPKLIYQSEKNRALKKNKNLLQVIWKSNRKA